MTIVTYHEGRLLGMVGAPIVDPDKLEVIAIHCKLAAPSQGVPIIMMRDVCEIHQNQFVIGTEEDISDASEIIRVAKLLENPFSVVRKPVVTPSGFRLGTTEDFTISSTSNHVQRLYVRRPILSSLTRTNLIIDISQIIEVTPKRFIVGDAAARADVLAAPIVS